jgi:hypothetical protein
VLKCPRLALLNLARPALVSLDRLFQIFSLTFEEVMNGGDACYSLCWPLNLMSA